MPIYEYECSQCGYRFEIMQNTSDQPLQQCPKCKAFSLVKCISASHFQLKGKGWYETDYKQKTKDNNQAKKDNATKDKVKKEDKVK